MLTITYADLLATIIPLAGQPIGKSPDAELIRLYVGRQLPQIHTLAAWPESCMDFVAVTLANGQFTKNEATQGDLLSLYANGSPQLTTIVHRLDDWSEGNGVIRVTVYHLTNATGTLYAEFQTPPAPLPAYGAAGLAAAPLPARYGFALAAWVAADIVAKEDPLESARLRREGDDDLKTQASQLKPPWWRR